MFAMAHASCKAPLEVVILIVAMRARRVLYGGASAYVVLDVNVISAMTHTPGHPILQVIIFCVAV